ncbi:hypothetical protein LTR66_012997 [Elasticomyces elasticus]|nr:hypothetical protein LTR66_012997 [Elasticomyces elasticus]
MADTASLLLSFPSDDTPRPEALTTFAAERDYDQQITNYISKLTRLPAREFTKLHGDKDMLDLLEPSMNSVAYLSGLLAHAEAALKSKTLSSELWTRIILFCNTFDPIQIRYVGQNFNNLIKYMRHFAVEMGAGAHAVEPMRNALLRVDPSSSTLTTSHIHFVELCIDAGTFRAALPVIDKDIASFPGDTIKNVDDQQALCHRFEVSAGYMTQKSGFSDKLELRLVTSYYLLCAHIYTGLRKYERARLFLEHVLVTPTNQCHHAHMLEAYKKWLLVGLLFQGKVFAIPKSVDGQALKAIRSLSRSYEAVVKAFRERDRRRLEAEIDVAGDSWQKDGNRGLIDQVDRSLMLFRVKDLEDTYSALPVSRVAKHIGLPQDATISFLTQTIKKGQLSASISELAEATANGTTTPTPVLRFHTSASAIRPIDEDAEMAAQQARIEELAAHVREASRRIALSKEYMDHQRRNKKADGGGSLAEDMEWDAPAQPSIRNDTEDEDMMADL